MSKVSLRTYKRVRKAKAPPQTVTVKEVVTASGRKVEMRSIPANGRSFANDFLFVFKENVKAARAENAALSARSRGRAAS